jgi:small subunit ribosomal protein S4
MARKLGSKCKLCRRQGEKLNLKGEKCASGKCPVVRRSYAPGQHGPTARPRHTSYGLQLREKQKARNTYGILETQFRNYFEKATRLTGNTADHLIVMLETRLDNVVYRLGLAKSRSLARQVVAHGNVRVNGRKVSVPSYAVKVGDLVAFSDRYAGSRSFKEEAPRIEKVEPPSWLFLDKAALTGKVLGKPQGDDLKQNFNPKLIVEFYSR